MRRPGATALLYLALAGILFTCVPPAMAGDDEDPPADESQLDLFDGDVERNTGGWSQFQVSAGLMYLDADGVFRARLPDQDPVTIIDFERVGLRETDFSHWISLTWRSAKSRWGAWFANWRYDVSGSREWEREFGIPGNPTVPAGTSVQTDFVADWYVAEVTYSFVQNPSVDAGIGVGVHVVDLETDLTARIDVGDNRFEVVQGDVDTLAPLPNILGYFYWKPASRWRMVARLGWFGLEYDKYKGRMTNAHYMVSYQVSERFNLGAGYEYVKLDVDIEEKRYTQIYDMDFAGPLAFLRFRF